MAVEKQVNVIISAVDQFSGVLTNFGGAFKAIALGAVAIEAAILAASVAAAKFAIDIGTDVFTAATDFYDAVFDIEAVASSFGTTAEEISGVLDDLVNKFPVTGKEGGEALQLIAQMGYGAEEELRKVSDAAMTLSIATGTELRTSAEGTMAIMNSFGLSLEEVDRVINLLAATSFTSAASVSDLREAMKFAAVTSALAGISLEETAAILGRLKDKGLEASQAGTTYRMAMVQITKESERGVIALAKYGLTYDDVNPSVVGLTGLIEAFGGEILSADDAQDIFGTRAKTIALVINDGAESFKKYTKTITDTNAAYEAADIKLGKWGVVMDNVGGSMDIFKKTIAAELVPILIELVGKTEKDGIRGIITQLMELEKISGDIGQPMIDLFENLKDVADDLFVDAFGDVEGFYDWLGGISEALSKNIEILAIWGAAGVKAFVGATDESEELTFILELVNGVITALMIPIGLLHDLFVGFFYALELGWDTAEYTFYKFADTISSVILAITIALDALPFVDLSNRIEHMEGQVKKWGESAKNAFDTEPPDLWTGKVIEASAKATIAINKFGTEGKKAQDNVSEATDKSTEKTELLASEIKNLGNDYEIIDGKVIKIKDSTKDLTIASKETTKAVKETEKTFSEIEKFELSLKKAKFESDLKIVEQAAEDASSLIANQLEWTAKIDIAEIEAAADVAVAESRVMESAFSSVSESIAGISGGLGAIAGIITGGDLWGAEKWAAWDLLGAQVQMQQDLVDAQTDLLDAQTKIAEIKAEKMKEGEAEIGVEIIGDTEGWLKGLMQSLFEEIVIKAQAETFSCFGVE